MSRALLRLGQLVRLPHAFTLKFLSVIAYFLFSSHTKKSAPHPSKLLYYLTKFINKNIAFCHVKTCTLLENSNNLSGTYNILIC